MLITVLRDIDCFRAIKDEWNALLERSSNNTLFLRWEWIFNYYRTMCKGQELLLLLVRNDKGQLKGIAPFILREERIITKKVFLEFIGQRYSYYLGIIASCNNRDDVYQAICDYLFENRRRWDLISFIHLSDDSLFKMHLKNHAKGCGYSWRESIKDSCKIVPLQESFDEYISCLDKHFSKRLKRSFRRIKRDFHVELSIPEDEKSLNFFWRKFLELHIGRIKNKGSKTILSNKEFQEFYYSVAQAMYIEKKLCLIALKFNKEIVAILFGITWKDTFYFLNIGYKKFSRYNLAVVLPVLCIERSIKDGLEYFDALGGGGDYKEKLGGVNRGGLRVQVLKPILLLENMISSTSAKLARKLLCKSLNTRRN